MLLSSLKNYKKNYPVNIYSENKANFKENSANEIDTLASRFNDDKNEYLAISNDIHSILSNCLELTNNQKLDFCDSQRYYMKLYLKEVLIQINKVNCISP